MPAYIQIEDLGADIPAKFLTQALDDNGDGAADVGAWDLVATTASEDVDAYLEGRFAVPFVAPVPALVKSATRVFALEKLYAKRGVTGNANPWTKKADGLRELLTAIVNCEKPLNVNLGRAKPSASVIAETAKTHSSNGNLSF